MVQIYRFAAVRPEGRYSEEIPSVPYDVVTAEEARECIEKNPLSFLRVSRSDAELPDLPPERRPGLPAVRGKSSTGCSRTA